MQDALNARLASAQRFRQPKLQRRGTGCVERSAISCKTGHQLRTI